MPPEAWGLLEAPGGRGTQLRLWGKGGGQRRESEFSQQSLNWKRRTRKGIFFFSFNFF